MKQFYVFKLSPIKFLVILCIGIGMPNLQAQIAYTDVYPDKRADTLSIDLNNDEIEEFGIVISGFWGFTAHLKSQSENVYVLGEKVEDWPYALALNEGDEIGPNQASWINLLEGQEENQYITILNEWSPFLGYWLFGSVRYLGLRFKIEDNIHFGWARIFLIREGLGVLMDYAYNVIPNEPIRAGQTTLGVESVALNKLKIKVFNKNISVFNLVEPTKFILYSIYGQEIVRGSLDKINNEIDAQTLASGIFLITLITADNTSTKRKISIP